MASGRQSDISADTSRSLEAVGSSIVALKQSAVIGPTPGTVMNLSDLRIITCQLENLTIEIVGLVCSMALRALSSGPTTAIKLGTVLRSVPRPARQRRELGTADHETDVLEQARTWFSRSRLILTSNARLASSALTDGYRGLDAHLLKPGRSA